MNPAIQPGPVLCPRWAAVAVLLASLAGCSPSAGPTPAAGTARADAAEVASRDPRADDLDARLAKIESDLAELRRQFAVPPGVEDQMKKLEGLVADPASWPADASGAERLARDFQQTLSSLSPMVQETLLPRVLPLRWALRAVWTVRVLQAAEPGRLESLVEEGQSLLAAAPEGAPAAVRTALEQELSKAHEAAARYARNAAMAEARQAIEGNADAAAALERLAALPHDAEMAALRKQLEEKIAQAEAAAQVAGLREQFGRLDRLTDDVSRQAAVGRLYESAVGVKVSLALRDSPPASPAGLDALIADLGAKLREMAQRERDRQAALARQYQKWALESIRQFDRWYYDSSLASIRSTFSAMSTADKPARWEMLDEFPSVRQLLAEKIGLQLPAGDIPAAVQRQVYAKVSGYVGWNYDEEIAYRVTRDAMVKYLLPIDERLLDRPVMQLYNQAFSQGWSKLQGRPDQLYVAQQAAVVEKHPLETPGGR